MLENRQDTPPAQVCPPTPRIPRDRPGTKENRRHDQEECATRKGKESECDATHGACGRAFVHKVVPCILKMLLASHSSHFVIKHALNKHATHWPRSRLKMLLGSHSRFLGGKAKRGVKHHMQGNWHHWFALFQSLSKICILGFISLGLAG